MDISDQLGTGFIKVPDLMGGTRRDVIADARPNKYDRTDLEFQGGGVLSLNVTNLRALVDAWGTETNDWLGKEIELYVGKTEFQGEKRDSVLIRAISPKIPFDQRPKPAPKAQRPASRDAMDDEIPF